MKSKLAIFIFAFLILLGRIWITPRLNVPTIEGCYESFAHLFVGFLILVPWYDRKELLGPSKLYGWIGWLLAFWELGWIVVQKAAVVK